MQNDVAIRIEGVSKVFKLPHEKNKSIKNIFVNFWHHSGYEQQQALKDVSFEVKKGDFIGIVGRNGSGKSTLLKLMAGIYTPTQGSIHITGQLTPFIELGVGFNPELTGRENVFLNGALLGFSRREMQGMYKDIVDFAEIKRFMDQKLKNYSTGMQVRLAFSIAIRAQSDILVLDEVLAVGDESFQRKCLDVFESYKSNKQTVILVTHDMETVKRFCNTAVLINEGKVIDQGDPQRIAEEYTRLNQEQTDNQQPFTLPKEKKETSELRISIKDDKGHEAKRFNYGEYVQVELSWPASKHVENAGVAIYSSLDEQVYATNTFIDGYKLDKNYISCSFKLELGAGKYHIMAGTFLDRPEKQVDFVTHGPSFNVNPEKTIKGEGITRLSHQWSK